MPTCPWCEGRGCCAECLDGTAESFYRMQRVGLAALTSEPVARVVEQIDEVPLDDARRALVVSHLLRRAEQLTRVA